MDTYILQTNHLCKNFKSQHAVSDISLSITRNSVYGLLGPNGAGKSTTLKMITGMLRPTSGKIIFEGHPWSRGDLADIGALIESPPLYENLTAKENLKVRTLLFGLQDSRIHQVLETVSLTDTREQACRVVFHGNEAAPRYRDRPAESSKLLIRANHITFKGGFEVEQVL